MPDGMSDRMVLVPSITSVWPALCPPWKRATAATRSVSRSTTLPLPSSPHCVPMMTTNLPTTVPLSHEKKNDDTYQHAAQAGDAQLAVGDLQQLRERALHAAGMQKGRDPFENEEQRQCR